MAKEYNIAKTASACAACEATLEAGADCVATLREAGDELSRRDFCMACWDSRGEAELAGGDDVIGIWKTCVPAAKEKKKLFVDDELLINCFQRLAGAENPARVNFRFVLALVLMRKKILLYDRSRQDESGEIWLMHLKGTGEAHEVLDPRLDEQKIAEVTAQLGEIMEGQL